jgi:hypothetical protein
MRLLFKIVISGLLGVIAIYLGLIAFLFGAPVVSDYASRTTFESGTWKNAEASPEGIRIRMVDDLLRKHPLVGMPRAEIDQLLGVPRETDYFADYEYVYWLGPERGLIPIDSGWLGIKFSNDVVSEAQLLRD